MDRNEDQQPGAKHVYMRRIAEARWTLIAAFGLLAYAVFRNSLTLEFALGGALFVLALTILVPRRDSRSAMARRRSSARLVWPDTGMKTVVDAFPLPCLVVDRKSIVRHGNASATGLIGPFQPGDPLAYRLRVPQVLDALEQVAAGGPATSVQWREKVPSDRAMEARFSPILLPGNQRRNAFRPDFVLIVFFDLTELHQVDRMRADFVANASHELRTPLASLTGFIETLQGPARNDEKARDNFLNIMLEQSNRMGRLINDLLSLSRIEMRGHVRPDTPVDPHAVIAHVVDARAPVAKELGVRIDTRLQHQSVRVLGDEDELTQVFENLIENALRYGAAGERIEISDDIEAPSVTGAGVYRVSVRDWGPGIPVEHLPRLTERFYRANDASSPLGKGTGLGLAIVKHIVNRHGGRLTISNHPEGGAVFTISLQIAPNPAIFLPKAEKIT